MLDPMTATKRWKWLKEQLSKVQDPILRNSMLANFQHRAIKEWGFCPDNEVLEYKEQPIIFTPEEQSFLDKIETAVEYGVFVKDEKLERETIARLKMFIDEGNTFRDLPEDLQTKGMAELYSRAYESWLADLDDVIEHLRKRQ